MKEKIFNLNPQYSVFTSIRPGECDVVTMYHADTHVSPKNRCRCHRVHHVWPIENNVSAKEYDLRTDIYVQYSFETIVKYYYKYSVIINKSLILKLPTKKIFLV